MKRRYADARETKDIVKSEFENFQINDDLFNGNISILKINEIGQKWIVDEEDRCILNKNYTWMEIYPNEKNYCITAMCDEKLNIIEWYFDVCKCNGIEDGVPYEDDLYIDVVIVPDGRIHVLDEDELKQAFEDGKINDEELQLAYNTKNIILEQYGNNIDKLKEITQKYMKELINQKEKFNHEI